MGVLTYIIVVIILKYKPAFSHKLYTLNSDNVIMQLSLSRAEAGRRFLSMLLCIDIDLPVALLFSLTILIIYISWYQKQTFPKYLLTIFPFGDFLLTCFSIITYHCCFFFGLFLRLSPPPDSALGILIFILSSQVLPLQLSYRRPCVVEGKG